MVLRIDCKKIIVDFLQSKLREINENLLNRFMGKTNIFLNLQKNEKFVYKIFSKKVKIFVAYQTTPREDHRAVEQNWVLCYKFCSQARRSSSPDFQKKHQNLYFFLKGL